LILQKNLNNDFQFNKLRGYSFLDIPYKKRQWVDMPIAMSSLSDTQEPRQDYETAGNLVIRVDTEKKTFG